MTPTDDDVSEFAIDRKSAVDQVLSLVREKILRGDLRPGTALPEVALAGRIGVSRNTLREAMRVLAHEGLVRHMVGRGAYVTSLTVGDVSDICAVRRIVEIQAVDATAGATAEQLAKLNVASGLAAAVDAEDWAAAVEWDFTFHRRLVSFLGSCRLDRFYATLLGELKLGLVLGDRTTSDGAQLISDHKSLYELLVHGQQPDCREALREHLAAAERNLISVIERMPGGQAG